MGCVKKIAKERSLKIRKNNMNKITLIILFFLFFPFANAQSIADFPYGWKNSWVLVKESIIPGKDVVLPEGTPLFIQETVKTYNWINNGEGTKLNIYVNPKKLTQYKTHGPYSDGPTAIGLFEDSDTVFVIEHLAGEPLYGAYDRDGNDVSQTHPSFHIKQCLGCHNGFRDVCIGGTCAVPIIDVFNEEKHD